MLLRKNRQLSPMTAHSSFIGRNRTDLTSGDEALQTGGLGLADAEEGGGLGRGGRFLVRRVRLTEVVWGPDV